MATLYLLNTPILTAYGTYCFQGPIVRTDALELMKSGYISAIGHESTALFLGELLGLPVPAKRQSIQMQSGDQAIIFRLKQRLPEGIVLNRQQLSDIPYELALLKRTK